MKILSIVLASAAVLVTPMTASARDFGGGHPAFRGPAPIHGRVGFEARPFARDFRGPGWVIGAALPALYWDAYLSNPYAYGLAAAPLGAHWVYVDGQALLIQNRTGVVLEVAPL